MKMRTQNFFISHPRSGTQWTKRRIKAIQEWRGIVPGNRVTFSHFGYNPMTPRNPNKQRNVIGLNVTVLMRDPCALFASYYCFYNGQARKHRDRPEARSPVEFVLGDYGISRLCSFLNDVDRVVVQDAASKNNRINYLFYEDLFNVDRFAKMMLPIMDTGRALVGKEIEILSKHHTMDRNAQINKYRETLTREAIDIVRDGMRSGCRLAAYRKRYLEKGD